MVCWLSPPFLVLAELPLCYTKILPGREIGLHFRTRRLGRREVIPPPRAVCCLFPDAVEERQNKLSYLDEFLPQKVATMMHRHIRRRCIRIRCYPRMMANGRFVGLPPTSRLNNVKGKNKAYR